MESPLCLERGYGAGHELVPVSLSRSCSCVPGLSETLGEVIAEMRQSVLMHCKLDES